MTFRLSKNSKENLEGVDSRLVSVVYRGLEISKIDFGIPELGGIRKTKEQLALFNQGVSKADGIKHRSAHQDGIAVDIFAYVGAASWEIEHLAQCACAMLQAAIELGVKLQWGGLWTSFIDAPHFQLMEEK